MAGRLNTNDPCRFADRRDAGRQLAERLGDLRELNPVVVGVAPNGMPIAAEIARVARGTARHSCGRAAEDR